MLQLIIDHVLVVQHTSLPILTIKHTSMPRMSLRHQASCLFSSYNNSCHPFFLENLHHILDGDLDDNAFDDDNDLFIHMAGLHSHISKIEQSCYLCERSCRKVSIHVFEEDLMTDDQISLWMNDDEFLCKY
jgi:ankyrin repeat protein